jgi:hypothetical protein
LPAANLELHADCTADEESCRRLRRLAVVRLSTLVMGKSVTVATTAPAADPAALATPLATLLTLKVDRLMPCSVTLAETVAVTTGGDGGCGCGGGGGEKRSVNRLGEGGSVDGCGGGGGEKRSVDRLGEDGSVDGCGGGGSEKRSVDRLGEGGSVDGCTDWLVMMLYT